MPHILTIDQSTSATKAVLFDASAPVAQAHIPHTQIHPQPGWVEHDPMEILANMQQVIAQVLTAAKILPGDVAALAITNQRETVVVWDKVTGQPVYNAIVWQCSRAETLCQEWAAHAHAVRQATGLVLSPFFSAAKVAWILRNVPQAAEKAKAGRLAMGTVDSWLAYQLTGRHVTDCGNASRTQLLHIATQTWDDDMLALFGIPRSMLPELVMSDATVGMINTGPLQGIPLVGLLGDSHAALLGHGCVWPGMAKASYGTGSSVVQPVDDLPDVPVLATSIAWGLEGRVRYMLEGNINCSGGTVAWLKDQLGLIGDASEAEALAASVPDSGGVYLVPAFAGLGAPHWRSTTRAALVGMTLSTTKAHVMRAAEEAIALQVADVVQAMRDAGYAPQALRVDGGGAHSDFLMTMQSGLLCLPVERNALQELSAYGAFLAARMGLGWMKLADAGDWVRQDAVFMPDTGEEERERLCAGWRDALAMVMGQG